MNSAETASSARLTLQRPAAQFVLVGFAVWTTFGLFLDGWAHSTQRPDSFFTPWHGVLYTGFLGAAASVVWQSRPVQSDRGYVKALLSGDRVSLAGLALFALGGLSDMVWHVLLGVEVNLAALLSPTHLLLMAGGIMAFSGPFRIAYRNPVAPPSLGVFAPALISLALVIGIARFFTMYASPFGQTVVASLPSVETDIHDFTTMSPAAFAQLREMWGVTTILFTTVLVLIPVLALVRRWHPPAGSLLVLFLALAAFEAAASELAQWPLALSLLAAGTAGELLVRRVGPVPLAVSLVLTLWGSYFVLVAVIHGLAWSPEVWGGVTVLSAGLAAALAYVPERALGASRMDSADEASRDAAASREATI